jgi:hypothetical protein
MHLHKLIILILMIFSCEEIPIKKSQITTKELQEFAKENGEESFMPLEVGNYWKNDDLNYTEVLSKKEIAGKIYYEVFTLIGGDGTATRYLRVDEEKNLIHIEPDAPDFVYTEAKFAAKINETFYTIGDQSVNDSFVKVVDKTENLIVFKFTNERSTYAITYMKGIGVFSEVYPYSEIKINGKVLK